MYQLKKKKKMISLLIGSYIILMIYSTLFLPVKAIFGEDESNADYGYYPVWEVFSPKEENSSIHTNSDITLTIRFNPLAWIVQLVSITLVYLFLLIRLLHRYKRIEKAAKIESSLHIQYK